MTAALQQLFANLATVLPAPRPLSTGADGDRAPDQGRLRGALEHVAAAVRAMPNSAEAFPLRDDFIGVGYAIKAALADDPTAAFDLFSEWAEGWTGANGEVNEPDFVAAEWARMKPPFRLGASWLYEQAEKRFGWPGRADAEGWFEDTGEPVMVATDTLFPIEEGSKQFAFIDQKTAIAQALAAPPEPLIEGLLDQHTMSVVYGDSNAGKTFAVLDMAQAIATGAKWGGMATTQTGVAYIAAEGGRGIYKRIAALVAERGLADGFFLLVHPIDLLRPDVDLWPLIDAIRALPVPIGLTVVDTLSRAMAGGDENSSVDMGAFVKNLTAIQTRTASHVMTIHHTGKDAARGARGHSLLRAALDTEIEVVVDEPGRGVIRATKQRDMELGFEIGFSLHDRVLGEDSRGRVIKSAAVALATNRQAELAPTAMQTAVVEAARTFGDSGATPAEINAALDRTPGQARSLRIILSRLVQRGQLRLRNRRYVAVTRPDPTIFD